MKKTTYTATCPLTGETRTRTSAHPYTHALSVKRTAVLRVVEGSSVLIKNSTPPTGLRLIRRTTAQVYGAAAKVVEIPADEQVTNTYSLVSFHESAELAIKAARQYENCGLCKVEATAVPCTPA